VIFTISVSSAFRLSISGFREARHLSLKVPSLLRNIYVVGLVRIGTFIEEILDQLFEGMVGCIVKDGISHLQISKNTWLMDSSKSILYSSMC